MAYTNRKLRVFLCHAKEDKPTVRELYRQLIAEGWMDVWLDEVKLLPGQEWDIEIEKTVEQADVVVVCLSAHSVDKEGYVQKELRFVLNIADEKPESTIFVVPVRLDDCQVPRRIRNWQYVDYFPNNNKAWAYQRLLESLKQSAVKFNVMTINIKPAVATIADRFSIHALGWAKVTVNSNFVEWPTQSVRELFFYILTSSKPVTKEQIANAIWVDQIDCERVKQRFKNELYRLRRTIGPDAIILSGEGYNFDRTKDYYFDVEDFEMYVTRARESAIEDQQFANYEKAVGLMKGPYLTDIDSAWVYQDRERIHYLFFDAAMWLAKFWWQQAAPQKTLDICRRVLEIGPAFEPAHQYAMRSYAALGDRLSVANQYKTCKDTLAFYQNLSVSKETETLLKQLIS